MDGVFLSPSEDEFVGRIVEELEHFMEQGQHHRVLLFPPLSSRLRYLIHRTVEGMELLSSFSVGEGWRRRTVICHSAVRLPTETSSDPKPGSHPARAQRPAQPWGRGGRGARLRPPGDPHGDGGRAPVGSGRIGRPARRRPEKAPFVPRGTRRKENWRERDSPGDGEAAPGGENCAGNSVREQDGDPGSAGERLEPDPGEGGAERPPCDEKEASSGNGQEGRDGDCSRCPGSAHTEQRPGEPGQGQGGTGPEGSEPRPQGEQRPGRDPAGPEGGSGSEPLEKHSDRWTEPGVTEPGVTEPGVTEAAVPAPGVTDLPMTALPVTEPAVTEPGVTEPGVTEPGVTAPSVPDLPMTALGVTEPGVTEPGVTAPPVTAPSVPDLPVTAPGVPDLPVTAPGVTDPPVTAPGVTEPSVTAPGVPALPVTEPGVTAPPVTAPSVTDLPMTALSVPAPGVTDPPVTALGVTDPPVTAPSVPDLPVTAPGVTSPGVPAPPVPAPPVPAPPVPAPPVAAPPALGSRPERGRGSLTPPAQPDSRGPEGGRAAPSQGSPSAGQGQQKPPQKVLEGPAEALAAPELLRGEEPERIHGGKEEEEDEEGSGAWRGPDLAAGDREGTRQSGLEDECTAELLAEIVGNLRVKEISIERVSVAGPGCGEGELGHVTEIYDFAPSLRTEDLLELFADFHESGFRIQWVDETHALGIFSSPSSASQALGRRYPCLKLRPLLHGSRQAKVKALQRPKLLQLGKERPQTDAAVARRLVSHALGWRHRLQGAEDCQAEPLEQQE